MTFLQRLRATFTTDPHLAALFAAGIDYAAPVSIAENMRETWEHATVRDPVFREALTRIAVRVDHAAVSVLWRFGDGSALGASDRGVWVL